MSFADNLQYLRKKNKITQEELAEELNLSRQSVSKWETGEAYPETDKLIILCDKFGVTLDEMLRGDVTKEEVKKCEEQKIEEDNAKEVGGDGECNNSGDCADCGTYGKRTMIGAVISSSTMVICAVIYLCLGFAIGIWHPTWLVFLGGVIVCMWSGGMLEDESGKSKKEKIGGLACGTIMVGSAIIFLSIGFACGIWHPTWIVFVIGAGLCGVIGTLTNRK